MYICNKKKGIKLKWILYLFFNIYNNKYLILKYEYRYLLF